MQNERRCEGGDGCEGPVAPYRVTDHEGNVHVPVFYCAECAELAASDWNGNTAAIEPCADPQPVGV